MLFTERPDRREIGDGKVRVDLGLMGEVASDLALEALSTDYNLMHKNAGVETKSAYAEALDYDNDGTLKFASYQYYRQFCALNQIW